jgi:hypothetical protein
MHHDTHASIGDAIDDAMIRAVVIAGLAGIALIHVLQLPGALDEAGYLGALFICAIVASTALAAVLAYVHDQRLLRAAGGLAGLILLGYLISRTVGLPWATDDIGVWTEPLGLVSMVIESLVVCVVAGGLAAQRMASAGAVARRVESPGRSMPGPATPMT